MEGLSIKRALTPYFDVGGTAIDLTYDGQGQSTNQAGPSAVTAANGWSYHYDANGNLTQATKTGQDTKTVAYSTFNKPTSITQGDKSSTIVYGPNQNRIKQIDSNNRTTRYIGGAYEEVTLFGVIVQKLNYVGGFAIFNQTDPLYGGSHYEYLHRDHLGSIVAISSDIVDSANDVLWEANGPWGERRYQQWDGPQDIDFVPYSTARGFTGQEHLDAVGLIHMNGRVYDPELGRFLSADPHVQAPYNTQSYNRYSYVFNNPLSYTDPTGYDCYEMEGASETGTYSWTQSTNGSLCGQAAQNYRQDMINQQQRDWNQASFLDWINPFSEYWARQKGVEIGLASDPNQPNSGQHYFSAEELKIMTHLAGGGDTAIGKLKIYTPKSLKLNAYKAAKSLNSELQKSPKLPSFITGKLRWAKQKLHLKGSAPSNKSYLNSLEDAQAVLDEIINGKGEILKVIDKENRLYFRSDTVTGTYINEDYGIVESTNIFMVKGAERSNVVPVNPLMKF